MDSSSELSCDGEYEVESIEGKNTVNGRTFYLIKWKNYPPDDNTWEPLGHLSCHELIKAYEAKHRDSSESTSQEKKPILKKRGRPAVALRSKPEPENSMSPPFTEQSMSPAFTEQSMSPPFKEIECIFDMKQDDGEVKFRVQYKDSEVVEWIPIDFVKRHQPQKVIAFYEKCITWEAPI